jgi:hypothetical protein
MRQRVPAAHWTLILFDFSMELCRCIHVPGKFQDVFADELQSRRLGRMQLAAKRRKARVVEMQPREGESIR